MTKDVVEKGLNDQEQDNLKINVQVVVNVLIRVFL